MQARAVSVTKKTLHEDLEIPVQGLEGGVELVCESCQLFGELCLRLLRFFIQVGSMPLDRRNVSVTRLQKIGKLRENVHV